MSHAQKFLESKCKIDWIPNTNFNTYNLDPTLSVLRIQFLLEFSTSLSQI